MNVGDWQEWVREARQRVTDAAGSAAIESAAFRVHIRAARSPSITEWQGKNVVIDDTRGRRSISPSARAWVAPRSR
jgi:hypothetical protein